MTFARNMTFLAHLMTTMTVLMTLPSAAVHSTLVHSSRTQMWEGPV